jgi:ElaB/YqjD/DUF883 family membrane-anchored ribosome-binding protein
MATAVVESAEVERTLSDRVTDACRRAAHLSHEASLFKSAAEDAIEDGVYAARRAMKVARRRVADFGEKFDSVKVEAAYRVKRHPFGTVAAAFGVGMTLGVAVAWMKHRSAHAN